MMSPEAHGHPSELVGLASEDPGAGSFDHEIVHIHNPPHRSRSLHESVNGYLLDSGSDDEGLHMHQGFGQRMKPASSRAHSVIGHERRRALDGEDEEEEAKHRMRHGWEVQLESQEQANLLSQNFFMYFDDKRHESAGNPPLGFNPGSVLSDWRMKDRLKTVSALLAVCLNVGVDPPDALKTRPCAKLECWIDPIPPDISNQNSTNTSNSQIGKNLQSQYENLSLRTRYKVILDPTFEELKRYTTSLRRSAHSERLLFHYNGHGVPKPTQSGEVWCFNRSYTQYIPVALSDLQDWVTAPALWVWDCGGAGGIVTHFLEQTKRRHRDQVEARKRDPVRFSHIPETRWQDCIHLAACKFNETLPTNPSLPADVFTSCLTTPIAMAVRFFLLQNPLPSKSRVTLEEAHKIPGKVSERRTPLGELNWIFTAITDTIAWNCLPKALFKRLFRQDLMVAALFRNFLLAQRLMRVYHCHPQSYPQLPTTWNHPLWNSWDLAVEMILEQLPSLIEQQRVNEAIEEQSDDSSLPVLELDYKHSDFFSDQLSAFEVYLQSAGSNSIGRNQGKPPEQLPIVLQVLLSQVHRLRALILLSKFLDLGPWAVDLALSIGIFPYVLKLLQSQAVELKPPMVFIWARILAVDKTCQNDLLKDQGYMYFTTILNSAAGIPLVNVAEHRAMCAFVIAAMCRDFVPGKQAVLNTNPEIIECCLVHMTDMENPLLRQFSCLCLSNLWKDFPPAKDAALAIQAHARIRDRSHDPVPEVRAACLDALTSFVSTGRINAAVALEEETLAAIVVTMGMDGSIMVRKELTIFYSAFIKRYAKRFIVAAWEQLVEEHNGKDSDGEATRASGTKDGGEHDGSLSVNGSIPHSTHQRQVSFSVSETTASENSSTRYPRTFTEKTIYRAVWQQILTMSADPHPEVALNAQGVVDFTVNALLLSKLGRRAHDIMLELIARESFRKANNATPLAMDNVTRQKSQDMRPLTPPSPSSTISKADGYFALTRSASVKQMVQRWTGWGPKPSTETLTPMPQSPGHRRSSTKDSTLPYRSRPLTPADAASLPPNVLDNITGPPHQPPAQMPITPNFVARDTTRIPELPLKSNFFTWASAFFCEPQMRPSEADEPGSLDYNQRLWRRNRNDKTIALTQPLKEAAGRERWDVPCGYFGIGAAPIKMVFHQFDNHLVTSDDRDSLAVWDWKNGEQLCRFSNMNPKGSRVTELRFINEDDQALLMTGSSDGVIRVFKNYENPQSVQLASCFRALSDLVASDRQSAGLVFDWQQGQGRILVAGDERVIRVWQAGQELCVADINSRSGSPITSLTSDRVEGNVFVAGFGNGSLRAYDQRLPSPNSLIIDWVDKRKDHRSWIVGVHLQRGGLRELISAESNGGVRLWDIRMTKPVAGLEGNASRPRNLRVLSVHEHAPVFALGRADHSISVYNTSLVRLSTFEPYMSYMRLSNTPRHAPITATAFHPHRMMLACGAINDGHVNLFRCEAADESLGEIVDEAIA